MPLKINNLTLQTTKSAEIGQIEFFDYFRKTDEYFPFLYLNHPQNVLNIVNWPQLVPYLYDRKIELIDNDLNSYSSFQINTMSAVNSKVTFTFTETKAINVINSLYEDKLYNMSENNGSNVNWNKTFTPLTNIQNDGVVIFYANNNYSIEDITISSNSVSISSMTEVQNLNIQTINLVDNSLEFGLFRLSGGIENGIVSRPSLIGKYLCSNNLNNLNGLNVKSQLIGHSHLHTHNLNKHIHNFSHTHGMNNHTHGIYHNHDYLDTRSQIPWIYVSQFGPSYGANIANTPFDRYPNVGSATKISTGQPTNNTSGPANVSTTDRSTMMTAGIENVYSSNSVSIDSAINPLGLKINSEIMPESYIVYPYMYGGKFVN